MAIVPVDISELTVINSDFQEPIYTTQFHSISTLLFGRIIQIISIIDYSPIWSMTVDVKKYIRRI